MTPIPDTALFRVTCPSARLRNAGGFFGPVSVDVEARGFVGARFECDCLYETEHGDAHATLLAVPCPNCQQWQWQTVGGDCVHECRRRGFA